MELLTELPLQKNKLLILFFADGTNTKKKLFFLYIFLDFNNN